MNLSLDNNVNKFVLLVVVGVVVLLAVNMNKKQLGNQASTIVSILVIVVCGCFGYTLLNDENELEQLSSNGYEYLIENHDWNILVDKLYDYLIDMCKNNLKN